MRHSLQENARSGEDLVLQDQTRVLVAVVLCVESHVALLRSWVRAVLALRQSIWHLVLVLAIKVVQLVDGGVLRLDIILAAQLPLVFDCITSSTAVCSGPFGSSVVSTQDGRNCPKLVLY